MKRVAVAAGLTGALLCAVPGWAAPGPTTPVVESVTVLPGSNGGIGPVITVDDAGQATAAATVGGPAVWRLGTEGWARAPLGGLLSAVPQGAVGGLDVDAAGYLHLAEATTAGVTTLRSIDGGETVDRGTPLAAPAGGGTPILATGRFTSGVEAASVTVASSGRLGVVVTRSIDGGLSFPQQVLADPTGCQACSDEPTGLVVDRADDSRVWLALRRSSTNRLLASTDGGRTFARTATVASTTGPPALDRSSDGMLVLAAPTASGAQVSVNGGAPTAVGSGYVAAVSVSAGRGGRIGLALRSSIGELTALTSDDGGTTWSAPVQVDRTAAGPIRTAMKPNGRLLVTYASNGVLQVAQVR